MSSGKSFNDTIIITCSVMKKEIEKLREQGFLDGLDSDAVLYTAPGNHERPWIMEQELPQLLSDAAGTRKKVLVALGKKCYFNPSAPEKTLDDLIAEHSGRAVRLETEDCFDMLCGKEQRKDIAGGRNVYWLTPGWLDERERLFGDWDQGKANETFPMHDTAVLLDALNFFEDTSLNDPETLLEFCDWMQLGIEPRDVTLDRFKTLLESALEKTASD